MDEQFVNELAVALRKVGTIHTVGEEWVSYIGEIPVGGVPYCGQMCTRETYSALWSYAQAKGLVKTEAEWQQIASANNGNVPFYSTGDGTTTFRMPKIVGYVKGASSQAESGGYTAEGLPNIEGNITAPSDYNFISDASIGQISESGALHISQWTNKYVMSNGGTSLYSPVALGFDASYSNPIYGASNHVTPETSVVLFGVYAFGAIVGTGELDATTLQTNLASIEANYLPRADANFLPLSGGTLNGVLWCNDALRATGAIRTFFDIGIKSSIANGGQITLYSEDDDRYPNSVTLISNDGTNYHRLRLLNNGRLELDGKSIVTSNTPFAPDYSAGVHIETTNTFTAPSAGIVFLICQNNPKGTSQILVNGILVSDFNNNAEYVDRTNYAFVAKGDVITFVPVGGTHLRRFYPLKVSV